MENVRTWNTVHGTQWIVVTRSVVAAAHGLPTSRRSLYWLKAQGSVLTAIG